MSELSIAESIKQDYEEEIEELKADIEEYRDSTTWWSDRFNAVERDNRELKKEIERLHSIIKEVREKLEMKIKGYKEIINTLIYSSVESKRYEIAELKYRIGEQEEILEILDKENK